MKLSKFFQTKTTIQNGRSCSSIQLNSHTNTVSATTPFCDQSQCCISSFMVNGTTFFGFIVDPEPITTGDSSTGSSTSGNGDNDDDDDGPNKGIIIGVVVGCCVVIAIVIIICVLCCRRRKTYEPMLFSFINEE